MGFLPLLTGLLYMTEMSPPGHEGARIQRALPGPGAQRDPFGTPQFQAASQGQDLLDELLLKGWLRLEGRAFVVVADRKGHVRWLSVGHRFTDGEIVAITETSVTFRQWDPRQASSPVIRTIVKTFERQEGRP